MLPAGIAYVAGSAPVAPTQIADEPAAGQTTLIWDNVADLSPGSDVQLHLHRCRHDPAVYTVGDTYTNNAGAYINTDPRLRAEIRRRGPSDPGLGVTAARPTARRRSITAVKIDKSEPSPEGELLRGVHDHQTTYTLDASRTTGSTRPTAVVVDDYLPARPRVPAVRR